MISLSSIRSTISNAVRKLSSCCCCCGTYEYEAEEYLFSDTETTPEDEDTQSNLESNAEPDSVGFSDNFSDVDSAPLEEFADWAPQEEIADWAHFDVPVTARPVIEGRFAVKPKRNLKTTLSKLRFTGYLFRRCRPVYNLPNKDTVINPRMGFIWFKDVGDCTHKDWRASPWALLTMLMRELLEAEVSIPVHIETDLLIWLLQNYRSTKLPIIAPDDIQSFTVSLK